MASSMHYQENSTKGVPSLVSMSRRVAIKHVDDIMTFADLAPHLLPQIIKKVSSPTQLRNLEIESPQIVGLPATAEAWKALIRRDIPDWEKKKVEPKNAALWWKVYRKLKREDEAAQKDAEDQLRNALGAQAAKKESNKSTILHSVLPEARTTTKLDHGVSRRTVGMDALKTLRRQTAVTAMTRSIAKKFTKPSASRNAQPVRPAHLDLAANRGTVSQAPAKMVQDYAKRAGLPASSVHIPSAAHLTAKYQAASRPQPVSRAQMRNPFRGTASSNRSGQEALNLAIKIEKENRARQTKEAERLIAAKAEKRASSPEGKGRLGVPKAGGMGKGASGPSPGVSASPEKRQGVEDGEKSRSPQPPPVVATGQAVKRKAPNIFMAQKKRKVG
ncbi:hypothetical protein BDZ85DRAFT_315382 [Elsinoe ampelina]|uniref:RNA polymerase II transcription factor SIII subunit A-domain-containing protein n=1 Tax=Elsinoe ampelina TaxID=302913 RepID=A0A6A6GQB9_9PEZI|nr:hypothetical protein BDZ85DRAFT_315382 [Elsinoe ampelina]